MQPSSQQPRPASQQSFIMSQPSSQPQATSLATSSFRQYSDQVPRLNDGLPQIYSAVYSSTDVYEMEISGIAVMRRRRDSWLNATQILKVAGVEKGRRTKILEKEIQTGEHEKVQGGYGKYQGTWIPFQRGLQVCRDYGVEQILEPLLTYDMGQDGGVAGSGDFNTPTKEQAMAAQRKRAYNATADKNANGGTGNFFKSISSTATHAVAAISKARFESPGPRNRNISSLSRAPSFNRQPSQGGGTDDYQVGGSQTSNFADNFPPPDANTAFSAGSGSQPFTGIDGPEPPRKRPRLNMTPANSFGPGQLPGNSQMQGYADAFPGSPTEPNDSFIYTQHAAAAAAAAAAAETESQDPYAPLPPLPYEVSTEAQNKRTMILSLFIGDDLDPSKYEETLRSMSPRDLDMSIDQTMHTALHWAATLARMNLLRALVAHGANPFRVNSLGQTALMRACIVTNSHDNNTMTELLDLLGSTIEVQDHKQRTVLHHIVLTSAVHGRSLASRYYLQTLLEWVVRQGARNPNGSSQPSNSQGNGNGNGAGPVSSQSQQQNWSLSRFMTEMLNRQDEAGNTALNEAARIGNHNIVSQLLEVCANPHIRNKRGLRPLDFGIQIDETTIGQGDKHGDDEKRDEPANSQKSRDVSDDIVTSFTHLLSETLTGFQLEMKAKQHNIDGLHTTLRSTSTTLAEERRRLEALRERVTRQKLWRAQALNLSRAREQEQYRLSQLHLTQGRRGDDPSQHSSVSSNIWETESTALLAAINAAANSDEQQSAANGGGADPSSLLPSAALLRARVAVIKASTADQLGAAGALKLRSRELEHKYRRLVQLATKSDPDEIDSLLGGLTRAVESEKDELEIGRVKRFLAGVEGVHV